MSNHNKGMRLLLILVDMLLSVLLFSFSNPNFLYPKGFFFLAWLAYLPVLLMLHRSPLQLSWLLGGIYAVLSYSVYAYWLVTYDFLAYSVCMAWYFLLYALLFFFLKLSDALFSSWYWVVQWLLLCGFDYLRTLGFAGFNYGILAYTQWRLTPLIQLCALVGVFGLNLIVVFPSALAFGFIRKKIEHREYERGSILAPSVYQHGSGVKKASETDRGLKKSSFSSNFLALGLFTAVLVFALAYAGACKKDYSGLRTVRIAAVQNNSDPRKSGINIYSQNIHSLMKLTDAAVELYPDISIVVWPETAVVPAIVYRYNSTEDEARHKVVTSLLSFIESRGRVFVLGNGHTVMASHNVVEASYNSALVFFPGRNVIPPEPELYSKMHLVPLSEYFPFEKQLPGFYKRLVARNDFWTPGSQWVTFEADGLKFSTPVCFEDTFSYVGRRMYEHGSRCFINLSDDSWSKSEACQYQHLAMALFRSVENRVPSVRSTASGQTCYIDPAGRIQEMAQPFSQDFIVADVPVLEAEKPTFYCRSANLLGEFWGYLPLLIGCVLLLIRLISAIINMTLARTKGD